MVLSSAIQTKRDCSFSDPERKLIFGQEGIPVVAHHPLVRKYDESNINPVADYAGPETPKQITHRYASVIRFPYVPPSKSKREYGVFCTECVLMMRYREHRWSVRSRFGVLANEETVTRLTKARDMGCRQYVVSEEAHNEATTLDGESKMMSLAEHYKTHATMDDMQGKFWKDWRKRQKGPPLPLFHHNRFG